MRALASIVLLVVAASCRRDRNAPTIASDPAAATSDASKIEAIAVRRSEIAREGPFEVRVSYPKIDLPSGAGAKISAELEDDLRRRADELHDRWTATPHEGDAHGAYRLQCAPTLVASEVVSVACHGSVQDTSTSMELRTYVWIVDDGAPRRLAIADVVGASKLEAFATSLSADLAKRTAKPAFSGADLVAHRALDDWTVVRAGVSFDFPPGAASSIRDELYAQAVWTTLRAIAQDVAIVDRLASAASAPDTLFGYPADASP
jgi:hypothetical protein